MRRYLRYFLAILLLLNIKNSLADVKYNLDNGIQNKISRQDNQLPNFNLFLRTDKNVYTNNEFIWFSAFLNGGATFKLNEHTVLFITITNKYNRSIQQGRYLMANGLSFGCLQLSDSIPSGNYHIIAHTNIVNKKMQPLVYFQAPLKVKYIKGDAMMVDFKPFEDNSSTQHFNFQLTAKEKSGKSVQDAKVSYNCNGTEISSGTTDKLGNKLLSIHKDSITKRSILVKIKKDKNIQYLEIPFQQKVKQKVNIKFYPEGGKIANDLFNTVGWVAKSADGRPLKINGILLEDNLPIDTIETESYGIGTFNFLSKPESYYQLKVLKNKFQDVDTLYDLPVPNAHAISLRVIKAVADDTLALNITSKHKKQITLLVHDNHTVFSQTKLDLYAFRPRKVKIALLDVPKGIYKVSILDSLNMPLAERDFFSSHNPVIKSELIMPKIEYHKKEQVNVKLMLKDDRGNPSQGIVSIAGIQGNRVLENLKTDIETHTYLRTILASLPSTSQNSYHNKEYLENLLLVGKEFKVQKSSLDSIENASTVEFNGNVTRFGQKLKKGIKLTLMRDSIIDIIETKIDGSFNLSPENMISTSGRKLFLTVNAQNKQGYKIELKSPEFNLSELEVDDFHMLDFNDNATDNFLEEKLGVFNNTTQLKEVVIKGRNDNSIFETFSDYYHGNPCGDYVAVCGGLNCELSGHNYRKKAPIKGKKYIKHILFGNIITRNYIVVYQGCIEVPKSYVFNFDGIYTTKEFYGVLDSNGQSTGTDYLSTIYWNPGLVIDKDGTANFSFLTSDITGKFKIIVEGMGASGLVYIEKEFTVN